MSKYASDPDWQDVIPMPQNDGGSNPLAAISYSDEYAEAMSYLRAIMSDDEKSERALRLTEHLISLNPAHYTVWSVMLFYHNISPLLHDILSYSYRIFTVIVSFPSCRTFHFFVLNTHAHYSFVMLNEYI